MAVERSSPPPADDDAIALGDDYLSPRSKVAKMLADIDNAPTPSPPSKSFTMDEKAAAPGPFMDDSEDEEEQASGEQLQSTLREQRSSPQLHEEEDDDDVEDEG